MQSIKHVIHKIADAFHPQHAPPKPPAHEPQDIFETTDRPPRPAKEGSMSTQNPMAGTAEEAPSLSAGALQSPQFLGTEAEYFKEARRILEAARPGDMLLLQMYEIENEATNNDRSPAREAPAFADQQALLPDLASAAARGVKVEVILDASKDPRSGEIRNDPVAQYLEDAAKKSGNLTLDYYPPETVNIDHAKELVYLTPQNGGYAVEETLSGGSNWGNHTPANDDGGATFFGPDALGAAQIFFRDQAFSRGERTAPAEPTADAKAPVQWKATSPHVEGGGSHGILDAKLALTQEASEVYVNEFCLSHVDLVAAIAARGAGAHVRLDPNEQHVNIGALKEIRKAGGQALWANTLLDPRMPAQKNHEKLDVYVDASGVPFALTIGSANDTANGLDGGSGTTAARTRDGAAARHANHEIDAVVRRYTSPDGSYSTAPLLDAALAKTKRDLEQASLDKPPSVNGPNTPGNF